MKSLVEKIMEGQAPNFKMVNDVYVDIDDSPSVSKEYNKNKEMVDGMVDIYTRYLGEWKVPVRITVSGVGIASMEHDSRKNGFKKFKMDFYESPEFKELEKFVKTFGYKVIPGVTWGINVSK